MDAFFAGLAVALSKSVMGRCSMPILTAMTHCQPYRQPYPPRTHTHTHEHAAADPPPLPPPPHRLVQPNAQAAVHHLTVEACQGGGGGNAAAHTAQCGPTVHTVLSTSAAILCVTTRYCGTSSKHKVSMREVIGAMSAWCCCAAQFMMVGTAAPPRSHAP
jgi:hypothetical protein